MKKLMLCAVLLCLTLPSYGQRFFIGGGAGATNFSDTFGNGFHVHGKAVLQSESGLAFDISSKYIVANHLEDTALDVKIVPVMVGLSHFIEPKSRISPYLGGTIGVAMLSGIYKSPTVLYGGKAGLLFDVARDLSVYVEAETFFITDSIQDIEVNPWLITSGILIKMAGKHIGIKKEKIAEKKKRRAYDRRRLNKRRCKINNKRRRRAI